VGENFFKRNPQIAFTQILESFRHFKSATPQFFDIIWLARRQRKGKQKRKEISLIIVPTELKTVPKYYLLQEFI
jgi:hypothetical protein